MNKNRTRLLNFFIRFQGWSPVQEDNEDDVRYLAEQGFLEYDEVTCQARLATYGGN